MLGQLTQILLQARQADVTAVLGILEGYQSPDPVLDPERWLLEALTCLTLAEKALSDKKTTYARTLLEQAKTAGERTPYYTEDLERRRLLLCHGAGMWVEPERLPPLEPELLLRAQWALEKGVPERAAGLLDGAEETSPQWHYLRGRTWEAMGEYEKAVAQYLQAEQSSLVYGCLERCYKALGDYKNAYEYACRQR